LINWNEQMVIFMTGFLWEYSESRFDFKTECSDFASICVIHRQPLLLYGKTLAWKSAPTISRFGDYNISMFFT
jgi:hypothetical protein